MPTHTQSPNQQLAPATGSWVGKSGALVMISTYARTLLLEMHPSDSVPTMVEEGRRGDGIPPYYNKAMFLDPLVVEEVISSPHIDWVVDLLQTPPWGTLRSFDNQ